MNAIFITVMVTVIFIIASMLQRLFQGPRFTTG